MGLLSVIQMSVCISIEVHEMSSIDSLTYRSNQCKIAGIVEVHGGWLPCRCE